MRVLKLTKNSFLIFYILLTLSVNSGFDVLSSFSENDKNQISNSLSSEIDNQFELDIIFNTKTEIKKNLIEILSIKPQEKSTFLYKTIPQEFITPPPKNKL